MYRQKVFLTRIKSKASRVKIVGKVHILAKNVKCGNNVTIYPDVTLWGDGEIVIGNNVDIGNGTIIFSHDKVVIKDNTSIAAHCYIIDSDHGMVRDKLIRKQEHVSSPIYIGEDVWIATGVKILKGSNIGDGAVIGAQSLVKNADIKPYSINVGIPTKQIGERK